MSSSRTVRWYPALMSHWPCVRAYHSFSQITSRQITTWIVAQLRQSCITYYTALQFRAVFAWVSKSNLFFMTKVHDWLEKLAFFSSNQNKTKTNRDSTPRVFPRFASATSNFFEFWLVHWIVCVLRDWLEWLLWFWLTILSWKLL